MGRLERRISYLESKEERSGTGTKKVMVISDRDDRRSEIRELGGQPSPR